MNNNYQELHQNNTNTTSKIKNNKNNNNLKQMFLHTNILDHKVKSIDKFDKNNNVDQEPQIPTLIKSKSIDDYNRKLQFLKYDINSIDRQINTMTNELATDEFHKNTTMYNQINDDLAPEEGAHQSKRNYKYKKNNYEYKPYKLLDQKNNFQRNDGYRFAASVGSNVGSPEWESKQDKKNRMQNFAEQVSLQNKINIKTETSTFISTPKIQTERVENNVKKRFDQDSKIKKPILKENIDNQNEIKQNMDDQRKQNKEQEKEILGPINYQVSKYKDPEYIRQISEENDRLKNIILDCESKII